MWARWPTLPAAPLLPAQTSELRNAAELLRNPGRREEPLLRLRERRRSVGSSSHLCGRHADVQDARAFLEGLVSWRGPRRSDPPPEDRWRANAVETICFDCGGSGACPACSHVGDVSLIDSIFVSRPGKFPKSAF